LWDCAFSREEGNKCGSFALDGSGLRYYERTKGPDELLPIRPLYQAALNPKLLFGMTFRAEGRARRLARLLQIPVTISTGIVKRFFGDDLGVLGVAFHALLDLLAFLPRVMALLTILQCVGMLFVRKLNPLVLIRCVKPGIVDGERVLLTEGALQDDQGSKEQNGSNEGNEFFVHETLTSFLGYPFFHKVRANHTKNNHVVKEKMTGVS
jgi:hypothetical protein